MAEMISAVIRTPFSSFQTDVARVIIDYLHDEPQRGSEALLHKAFI